MSGADSAGRATQSLCEYVADTRWEDVPAAVRHEAKRSLLNFFAAALAGCRDPAIEIASLVTSRFAGASSGTVIGRGERTDPLAAAFLNAASANVFDFDDTHTGTIIHPTAPVAPALFALSEAGLAPKGAPLSGQQWLLAFVLGVEIECRIGNAVSPGHYARGWHITSTCGVFGAAVAAAKSLALDARAIAWALGNASAQASGLVETLGTMSKSISVGNAARNGLLSALLAQQGFEGPALALEGPRGFLHVTSDAPDLDMLMRDIGQRWELQANTYKPYPCGVVLNPVIEACLELSGDPALATGAIASIEIVGHPLLRQRTDRPEPANGRQAQVSAQHAAAVALLRGRAGLAEFSDAAVADPGLRALGQRLRFIDDDLLPVESARVTIRLDTDATLSRFIEQAQGSTARPLTDADLERKLAELVLHGGSDVDVHALATAVWSLDSAPDAGAVIRLAAGARRCGVDRT